MPKKSLPILLLVIFFVSHIGYYTLYTYQLYQVKEGVQRELISRIPDAEFEVVCLEDNAGKIRWEEEGKEFRLNGRMYDVARIKKSNGKTFIYCYNDSKEEKLVAAFSKKLSTENDPGSKHHTPKPVTYDWIRLQDAANLPLITGNAVKKKFYDFTEKLFSITRKVSKPPPDIASIPHQDHFIYTLNPAGFKPAGSFTGFSSQSEDYAILVYRSHLLPLGSSPARAVLKKLGSILPYDTTKNIPIIVPIYNDWVSFTKSSDEGLLPDHIACLGILFVRVSSSQNAGDSFSSKSLRFAADRAPPQYC